MKNTVTDLAQIIETYSQKFNAIADDDFTRQSQPGKWSKKQVLGHLIDSAQNNLRRFICGQYESTPSKITYDQNNWVDFNNYQQTDSKELIALWALINKRIVAVLTNMPEAAHSKLSDTGKSEPSLHTLQFLAEDYMKHLKHHIDQIIPHSFGVTYP